MLLHIFERRHVDEGWTRTGTGTCAELEILEAQGMKKHSFRMAAAFVASMSYVLVVVVVAEKADQWKGPDYPPFLLPNALTPIGSQHPSLAMTLDVKHVTVGKLFLDDSIRDTSSLLKLRTFEDVLAVGFSCSWQSASKHHNDYPQQRLNHNNCCGD